MPDLIHNYLLVHFYCILTSAGLGVNVLAFSAALGLTLRVIASSVHVGLKRRVCLGLD